MARRDRLKARAAKRNAARQAEKAVAVAELASPEDALRARIRNARIARETKERGRIRRLCAATNEPGPDATVTALLEAAQKQRDLAAKLDKKAEIKGRAGLQARKDRRGFIEQAKAHEIAARAARERQLELWRRGVDTMEIDRQAKARGAQLDEVKVEVSDWDRDEHGAVRRDDKGLPRLAGELATVRRQRHGLDWLLSKKRIGPETHRYGKKMGAIWEAAAVAAEPGRGGGGGGMSSAAPAGPANWRLKAARDVSKMEAAMRRVHDPATGAALVALCKAVCYEGRTIQSMADEDRIAAARMEERLKHGIAVARHWVLSGGLKDDDEPGLG